MKIMMTIRYLHMLWHFVTSICFCLFFVALRHESPGFEDKVVWNDEKMMLAARQAERDEQNIVEVPYDRNEIRDEVDGRQRVGDDCGCEQLCVERRPRIARGEIERERVPLQ